MCRSWGAEVSSQRLGAEPRPRPSVPGLRPPRLLWPRTHACREAEIAEILSPAHRMPELWYGVHGFQPGNVVRLTKTPETKPFVFENSFKTKGNGPPKEPASQRPSQRPPGQQRGPAGSVQRPAGRPGTSAADTHERPGLGVFPHQHSLTGGRGGKSRVRSTGGVPWAVAAAEAVAQRGPETRPSPDSHHPRPQLGRAGRRTWVPNPRPGMLRPKHQAGSGDPRSPQEAGALG